MHRSESPKHGLIVLFVFIAAMPVRLWFSVGPFKTCTILDIAVWLSAAGVLVFSRFQHLKVGHRLLFIALCTPVVVAVLSLIWSEHLLSTVKIVIYYTTAIFTYLVAVNLFRRCSPRFIVGCVAIFVMTTLLFAIIYWFRVPFALSLAEISIGQLESLDEYTYAVAFARLNHPYLGLSNDFATTLVLYVFFFIGVAQATWQRRYIAVAGASALGVLLTLSRGIVLVMVGVVGVALMLRFSVRTFVVTVMMIGLLIIPVYLFTEQVRQSGIDILGVRVMDYGDIYARFDRFSSALRMIEQSPLLGYGGGGYMGKDVDAIDSAFHNTYLEQWADYGIVFGSLVVLALLSLPWSLFRWAKRGGEVKTVARFTGFAIIAYLLVCAVETSNEAVMSRLMFYLFLGWAVAYLNALQRERMLSEERHNFHEPNVGYHHC